MAALGDVVTDLESFSGRGSCTDAERRAALWLHDGLRARGFEAWMETLWVRPQWWWSLFWHAALGIAASLIATASAIAGIALAGVVAASYALELAGLGGLRLLFFRRATQVVLVEPRDPGKIALWLVAATDAPRRGLVFRDGWRRWGARLRPGPLWWVLLTLVLVLGAAIARELGAQGRVIGVVQFVPTIALLLVAVAGLDVGLSDPSPGANADASGVALALDLHAELAERPPEKLSAGLVLAGAGDLFPYGFRTHLRKDRPVPRDTVLLECGPVGAGTPAWTTSHPQLKEACIAAAEDAVRHRSNRPTAAGAGRWRRIPGVGVRCIDAHGIPPRARTEHDTADHVEEDAIERARDFCLRMVDTLDGELG